MDITIPLQQENLLKHVTNVRQPLISFRLDIGHVKIYGLEKEGPLNHLLQIEEVNINIMDPLKGGIKKRVKIDQKHPEVPFRDRDVNAINRRIDSLRQEKIKRTQKNQQVKDVEKYNPQTGERKIIHKQGKNN